MQITPVNSVKGYERPNFKSKIKATENFRNVLNYYIEKPYMGKDFAVSLRKILSDGKNRILNITSNGFGTITTAFYEGRVSLHNKILSSTNGCLGGLFENEKMDAEDSLHYYDTIAREEGYKAAADAVNKFVANDEALKKTYVKEENISTFEEIKNELLNLKKDIFN